MSSEPAQSAAPLANHLSALVERRLAQLRESLKAARRGGSVEAVHDLRVASRRLRAFGVTLGGVLGDELRARLEKDLARVTRGAGALRDLDVQVGLLEEHLATTPDELERAALEHLLEQLDGRRATVTAKAESRLRRLDVSELSRRVRRATRTVLGQLSTVEAQRNYARAVFERLVAGANEQVPPEHATEDPERLHRLRIDCKELRYALELFEPLLGTSFQPLHERATTLQNLLGTYHDLTTLDDWVAESGAQLERQGRRTLGRGVERVRASFAAQRQAVLERFWSRGFDAAGWRETLESALPPD
jgi:CHAD domain-containing protein